MPLACQQEREIKYSESVLVHLFQSVTEQEFGCLISSSCLYDHLAKRNLNKLQQKEIEFILKLFEHNKDYLGKYCLKTWPNKYYEPRPGRDSEIHIPKYTFQQNSNWGYVVRTKFSIYNRYCKIEFTSCKKIKSHSGSTSTITILARCLFPTCNLKFSLVCKHDFENTCDNELTFKVSTSGSCIHLKNVDTFDSMKLMDSSSPIKSSYSPYQEVIITDSIGSNLTKDLEDDHIENYRIPIYKTKSLTKKDTYKDINRDICSDQNQINSSNTMTENQSTKNKLIKTPVKRKVKSKNMNISAKGSLSNESKGVCKIAANCTSVNGTLVNPMEIKRKIYESDSQSFDQPKKKQRILKKSLPPHHALLVSYL